MERGTNVVVYRSEHLLRRNEQTCHLPDRHLEIHLGEFEQSGTRKKQQQTVSQPFPFSHEPLRPQHKDPL